MRSKANLLHHIAAIGGIGVLVLSLSACGDGRVSQQASPKGASAKNPEVATVAAPQATTSAPSAALAKAHEEPLPHYNVHFDINSAELSSSAVETLHTTVTYLREHPSVLVRLSGYTDVLGSTEGNKRLAERRVARVASFLEESGIVSMRVTAVAVGEVESNLTPAGESPETWNRRVEIGFSLPPNS